jgi:DeoR/GlpR family transcriptional regulator of sugar metabolism
MVHNYSLAERRNEIWKLANRNGRVSVASLSARFGVSEVTIRGDLQALAEHNLILRTHGGAIPMDRVSTELSLALRRQQQVLAKDHIGAAAAAKIDDGDAVFLDTSSTALAIARRLDQHCHVTVITNSVAIIDEVMTRTNLTLVVPGGQLQRETASLIGTDGLEMLGRYNIQKGFFGAHGLSLEKGLTDVSANEAEVKRVLVNMCRQVLAVLDATKWNRVGLASFATVGQIDAVITDMDAPADLVAQAQALGIDVTLV